jgi:hypothetical protein
MIFRKLLKGVEGLFGGAMTTIHLDSIPVMFPSVVGRIVDEEAVLVLPEQGQVKVLNPVGARIWTMIDGIRNIREIAALIGQEYEVEPRQAEEDTLQFISDLELRKVLRIFGS